MISYVVPHAFEGGSSHLDLIGYDSARPEHVTDLIHSAGVEITQSQI